MITPELTNYINQAKVAGMANQQIKEELIKAGWQQADVDKAFSGATALSANLPTAKKMPILKIGIFTFLGLLLVAGSAGAFWYADKQFDWGIISPKKVVENIIPSQTPVQESSLQTLPRETASSTSPSPSATPTPQLQPDITGLKLFENEYFSFGYPKSWGTYERELTSVLRNYGKKYSLKVYSPDKNISVEFSIEDPAIFVPQLERSSQQKEGMLQAVQDNDLEKFINTRNSSHALTEHVEFISLNGKEVFISATGGNGTYLYGPSLEFLSRGNYIRVQVMDITQTTINQTVVTDQTKNLLGLLYGNSVYYKILESIKIK